MLRLETSGKEPGFQMIEPPRILMLRESDRAYVSSLTDPSLELSRRSTCKREEGGAIVCLLPSTPPDTAVQLAPPIP